MLSDKVPLTSFAKRRPGEILNKQGQLHEGHGTPWPRKLLNGAH